MMMKTDFGKEFEKKNNKQEISFLVKVELNVTSQKQKQAMEIF